MRALIIGTRGSSLSLCQAQIVQTRLEEHRPDGSVTLKTIKAQADKNPELPLVAMGGEGVFVKELEAALLEGQIDCAVHSMKDLPLEIPQGLRIAAVLEREEPRDAVVSWSGEPFDRLPAGSRIGTSSVRRRSQLLHRRGDLQMLEIRGNVDTRLRKLDEGQYDAIVIAACGLIRLGLEERISEYLDLSIMLPEPGQGALAIEARADDPEMLELLSGLEDPVSRACVEAERSFLAALGGGCRVPIAAYASYAGPSTRPASGGARSGFRPTGVPVGLNGELELEGAVIAPDGSSQVRGQLSGPMTEPLTLGNRLAEQLTQRGAQELLKVLGSRL